jgi:hypothetical protein
MIEPYTSKIYVEFHEIKNDPNGRWPRRNTIPMKQGYWCYLNSRISRYYVTDLELYTEPYRTAAILTVDMHYNPKVYSEYVDVYRDDVHGRNKDYFLFTEDSCSAATIHYPHDHVTYLFNPGSVEYNMFLNDLTLATSLQSIDGKAPDIQRDLPSPIDFNTTPPPVMMRPGVW